MTKGNRGRARAGTAIGLVLLLCLGRAPLVRAQGAAAAAQARAAAAAPAAPVPPSQDFGWPRKLTREGATLVYYEPQVDEWASYQRLKCRVAFALTPQGGKEVHGVASLSANTLVDNDSRTVFLRDIAVTSVRFPSADPETARHAELLFRTMVPSGGEPIALERLTAAAERARPPAQAAPVKNDPPPIFYSGNPALLLLVDGEPVLAPIEGNGLEYVVNTNWDLFRERTSKQYYLLGSSGWLTAKELNGPWTPATELPADMAKLPQRHRTESSRAAPRSTPRSSGGASARPAPRMGGGGRRR